jgi:hypothetical protein
MPSYWRAVHVHIVMTRTTAIDHLLKLAASSNLDIRGNFMIVLICARVMVAILVKQRLRLQYN